MLTGNQNVTVDSSFLKPSAAQLVAEGTRLCKKLAKWNELADAHIIEQETVMSRAAPAVEWLRLELDASKQEAEKAKKDFQAAKKDLLAERQLREEADKAVLAERAKVEAAEADAAKLREERDKLQAAYDFAISKREEWKSLHSAQAKAHRNTRAILAQREKDIETLQTDVIPNMCAQYRDQAEEATREVIRELFPEGSFPWQKFDHLLDDKAAAAEAKAAEEAEAKKASEEAAEKAAHAEKVKAAREEAERAKAAEAAKSASRSPTNGDAVTAADGQQKQA
uniref:Uncharacterized protein n=1 Tax=Silene latifolia TaxID=37657 RepID=Q3I6J3_SILLA|nr:unknown [Silene latifolia]